MSNKVEVEVRPKLDLKLNLSPPIPWLNSYPQEDEPSPKRTSISSCHSSSVSSSSELSSPMEAKSMMLVGCPRCLMYVMLSDSDKDPKCPKCKTTVLLEISS